MKTTIKIITYTLVFLLLLCTHIQAQNSCGNEAGIMPNGFFPACAGGFVRTTAFGMITGANSSLIYILHDSSSSTQIGNVITYNSTGIFYNDGTLPTNLDLFISAYTGPLNPDGSPVISDECADVALPGTPVRLYEPIKLTEVSSTCDPATGCLTVDFFMTGGAPGFPGNIFFNYLIEGDYNGIIQYPGDVASFTVCDVDGYFIEVVAYNLYCGGLFGVNAPCGCASYLVIDNTTPFRELYQSSNSITTSNTVEIHNGEQVQFKAPRVRLNTGFNAKVGCNFKVRNGNCN